MANSKAMEEYPWLVDRENKYEEEFRLKEKRNRARKRGRHLGPANQAATEEAGKYREKAGPIE